MVYCNIKIYEKRISVKEFSIYQIFQLIIKNIFIIILCAILFGVAAFTYCEFKVQERYAAYGSVVVTNGGIFDTTQTNIVQSDKVNNSDISASINLLTTVRDILSTNDIYKELSEKLDGEYSYGQLKSFATISRRDDLSLFIDVKFEMHDKSQVAKITNMFLELTPEYINKFIPNSSTTIVTTSDTASKTYPRTASTAAIAALIGALVAFAIIYIISLFNTTIESEEDFKERYNIPVLGDIPDFATAKSRKYAKSYYKGGEYYGN